MQMEGPANDRGVNSRALTEVFRTVHERGGLFTYTVKVSCVEIYCETARDLFVDAATYRESYANPRKGLDIRHGPNGPYIPDLTELPVHSVEDVQSLLNTRAAVNRQVAATAMNDHSSRSHLLLFVSVVGYNPATEEKSFGKLILVGTDAAR
jgi:kinesin family member C2/C3